MSLFKRGRYYQFDIRWMGIQRIRVSARTTNRARARAMLQTLRTLYSVGRTDLLNLLASRQIALTDLHDAYLQRGDQLEHLKARAESPCLGNLVDEWLEWLESPSGVSPRTRRRYAKQTTRRYRVSWEGFFEVLSGGRGSRLSDVTQGFVADYKNARIRAEGGFSRNTRKDGSPPSPATLNRDLVALSSFLRWCREEKGLTVERPRMVREREPRGKERWLSPEEVHAVEVHCEERWWPLFATLVHSGMRVGEAQGLVWGDVRITQRRITIHEGVRRVKTASSVRDVPISEPLADILIQHATFIPSNPADPVFPAPLNDYSAARHAWQKTCLRAGLHDGRKKPKPNATLHDLRHTFGVCAAQAGVPIVRLQKLLGHTTPHMTLRYMQHAPEAYFKEDAAKIAKALTGEQNIERDARANVARSGLKRA